MDKKVKTANILESLQENSSRNVVYCQNCAFPLTSCYSKIEIKNNW